MFLYSLQSIPYYDSIIQSYMNILILNQVASGPLQQITKKVVLNKLTPFDSNTNSSCPKPNCVIAITQLNNRNQLMCIDQLPELFEFLINNGYTIDTNITKILQKTNVKMSSNLICMIQY
jgi:hypothetical protein